MGIRVAHQPSAASVAGAAMAGGAEDRRRYQAKLKLEYDKMAERKSALERTIRASKESAAIKQGYTKELMAIQDWMSKNNKLLAAELTGERDTQLHAQSLERMDVAGDQRIEEGGIAHQRGLEGQQAQSELNREAEAERFRGQLIRDREQAAMKELGVERRLSAGDARELERHHDTLRRIAQDGTLNDEQKADATRQANAKLRGVTPSALPKKGPSYPEGQGEGASWIDEATGALMGRGADGEQKVLVKPKDMVDDKPKVMPAKEMAEIWARHSAKYIDPETGRPLLDAKDMRAFFKEIDETSRSWAGGWSEEGAPPPPPPPPPEPQGAGPWPRAKGAMMGAAGAVGQVAGMAVAQPPMPTTPEQIVQQRDVAWQNPPASPHEATIGWWRQATGEAGDLTNPGQLEAKNRLFSLLFKKPQGAAGARAEAAWDKLSAENRDVVGQVLLNLGILPEILADINKAHS